MSSSTLPLTVNPPDASHSNSSTTSSQKQRETFVNRRPENMALDTKGTDFMEYIPDKRYLAGTLVATRTQESKPSQMRSVIRRVQQREY
ncbi:hypothetical protein D9756_011542 [Leucocoprinus leucothites]|uniref:Uncharacterized protein n=1 Tax=Leucocoprinus leucothites TaxID=201217 RepID=A0A8H5CMN6_9AGAR|nr:hypothetical protein D9756_011542 [Leucoagaricus leucothites]